MHVFLSYARSSEEQATHAERALREEGYNVWRDTELPAHLSYAEVIEERLKSAKAVLVLWSAEAAKSQWVRAEADSAREAGTLVQSSVDGTIPPIPFNQIQCADLRGWSGESNHAGWRKLRASIIALVGQAEMPAPSSKPRSSSSICVLPFQNRSGDDVPDYFCDGISEDITSDLTKTAALTVVPRKTAFSFKGQDVDPCVVAEKLAVGYVLEGEVRRAGDRVRITTQLIDGSTGEQAWSDRYYREFTDVFSVQDEIAQTIANALKSELLVDDDGKEGEAQSTGPKHDTPPAAPPPLDPEPTELIDTGREIVAEPVSILDRTFDGDGGPDVAYASDDWSSPEEWVDEDEVSSPKWGVRRFQTSEFAPRLIALGLVAVLAAVLLAVFYWPSRTEQTVPKAPEKDLNFTVTSTVNVRSLPSRYNSRILGTLEKGQTINIVPDLAGAQPDWLKIKDGPYVGAYVWRESTRPTSESDATEPPAPRKDATG